MQIPQYKSNGKFGFNMTPMIDVVFLLIIFFLVSSHLAKQENQEELELPIAVSSEDDIDVETPRVTVNVKADGTMSVAGRSINRGQLKPTFEQVKKKEGPNVEIRIRSSRSAPYSAVEPIMLAATKSGVWNVTYAVYREDQ